MDWAALIWTIVWIVGGLIALAIVVWIVIAALGISAFNRVKKEFDKDFNKAFDSDFFKQHR